METVKDLIKDLEKMPQDKLIYIYEQGDPMIIRNIFLDKDGDVGISTYPTN